MIKPLDDYTKYKHAKRIIEGCNTWDTTGIHLREWVHRIFRTDSEYYWLLQDLITDKLSILKSDLQRRSMIPITMTVNV